MAPQKRRNEPRHSGTLKVLYNVSGIFKAIRGGRATRQSLADELELSTKQIKRYLDVLTEFGVQYDSDEDGNIGENIRIRSPIGKNNEPLNIIALNKEEFYILFSLMAGLTQVENAATKNEIFKKISNALGADAIDIHQLKTSLTGFTKAYKSYEGKRTVIATLMAALATNQVCSIQYKGMNGKDPEEYIIHPYQMTEFDGGLYVFAFVPQRKGVRLFAIERMASASKEGGSFFRKKDIENEIATKKQQAFRILDDGKPLKVMLRFIADKAPYVRERHWHDSQKITQNKDGKITLSFTASGRVEIVRWILSWGADCEVLGPPDLKAEVVTTLKAAAKQY
ncbi:MAG: WYL domain-containing protein [Deltaproteobacteria bacterium]|nr:WYL domain-containing protein [Deltaproteobacteria bacterium]